MNEISEEAPIVGVLLAGGQSRRMGGGDKTLNMLDGKSLLMHVVERAVPQVQHLFLNANGDEERFSKYGLPVVADTVEGFVGPLAGILTGMEWTRDNIPEAKWVLTVATDTPFFPINIVEKFLDAIEAEKADMAMATSGGNRHPVFGLWPVRLADDLRQCVVEKEMRKVLHWTDRFNLVQVDFPTTRFDPFFNVNTPEDLTAAQNLNRESGS